MASQRYFLSSPTDNANGNEAQIWRLSHTQTEVRQLDQQSGWRWHLDRREFECTSVLIFRLLSCRLGGRETYIWLWAFSTHATYDDDDHIASFSSPISVKSLNFSIHLKQIIGFGLFQKSETFHERFCNASERDHLREVLLPEEKPNVDGRRSLVRSKTILALLT